MNAKKIRLVIVISVLAIVGIACYSIGRDSVHSDRIGFDTVNTGLNDIKGRQQTTTNQLGNIAEGLGVAEDRVIQCEATVIKVETRLTDSTAILRRDAEIINRDSAILERIRRSGAVKD